MGLAGPHLGPVWGLLLLAFLLAVTLGDGTSSRAAFQHPCASASRRGYLARQGHGSNSLSVLGPGPPPQVRQQQTYDMKYPTCALTADFPSISSGHVAKWWVDYTRSRSRLGGRAAGGRGGGQGRGAAGGGRAGGVRGRRGPARHRHGTAVPGAVEAGVSAAASGRQGQGRRAGWVGGWVVGAGVAWTQDRGS